MNNTAFTLITENLGAEGIAQRILAELMIYRRVPEMIRLCPRDCQKCASSHLPKIIAAVEKMNPLRLYYRLFQASLLILKSSGSPARLC